MRHSLFVLLAGVLTLHAQEFRASITGQVTDPSGSPVPRAKVVATNVATNGSEEAITNEAGRYVISFLAPAKYTVVVEHPGFKKFVRENVVLGLSQRLSLDIPLEVGQVSDSVTVRAEVSLLQTETAMRVATIERSILEKAPNNGRNPFLLTHTLPGVEKSGY